MMNVTMIIIRIYNEAADGEKVGNLIAQTYRRYNLDFASSEEQGKLLGPFQYARSTETSRQADIACVLRADMMYVAEDDGEIVGVLRGRLERIQSLFVRGDRHRQGIGRRLVETFEQECVRLDCNVIRLAATLYAIPFYQAMGYRKSSGVRNGWSFEGTGLKYQPMKKVFR